MSLGSSILPFMFGADERQLFGVLHRASTADAARRAVLVCGPFGREAIRVHRLLRVLADRLTREGHTVLRFDYYGAGDSHGSDTEADFEGWKQDILEADRELRNRAGTDQVVWVGMRLGALAMLGAAAERRGPAPRLVLWDPIVDGQRYLGELRRRHVDTASLTFSLRRRALLDDPTGFSEEQVLGYARPPEFERQLARLSADAQSLPSECGPVRVMVEPASSDGQQWLARASREPGALEVVPVLHGMDWLSSAAENVALVPAPALGALLKAVQEAA